MNIYNESAHMVTVAGLDAINFAYNEIINTQFITIGDNKYFVLSVATGVLDERDQPDIPTLTITYDVNDVIYV